MIKIAETESVGKYDKEVLNAITQRKDKSRIIPIFLKKNEIFFELKAIIVAIMGNNQRRI